MKRLYLANGYGFSKQQRTLLPELIKALNDLGIEVWEPFSREIRVDNNDVDFPYFLGQNNVGDIERADGIFAVCNGSPPDDGVMIELGIATALKKKIFLFRDDFRQCTDNSKYPLNVMAFVGLPCYGWKDFYYTSVEEISDPNKELVRWVKK